MAAIASQQALAAKTSVAGAKLNLKNKAARKTVKAFSARAQAVATKAVRHAADPPPRHLSPERNAPRPPRSRTSSPGRSPGRGGARTGRARRVSFRGEVAGGGIGRVTHRLGGDRLRARGERLDGLARGLVLEVELRAGDRGLGGESLLGSDSGHRVCEGTVVELGVRKE